MLAHFADGTVRDVTELACYSSSDSQVADVNAGGLVDRPRPRRSGHHRPLPGAHRVVLPDVRQGHSRLRLDQSAGRQLHRRARRTPSCSSCSTCPSGLCSDEEFLRRVYLDVIGQLPTLEETKAFLADSAADKRAKLIDQLLERPEHAKFWALKWGDLLRLTSTQIGSSGVFKYHRWLERAFETNMPYDQFARELLTASGSTLDNPAANFYRTATDTQDSVESISQVFLGARLQCAKCHNHPFERWTQDNYYGMAAFFNRVQRKKSPRGRRAADLPGRQRRSHAAADRQADEALAAGPGRDRSARRQRPPRAVRRLADRRRTTRCSPRSRPTASGASSWAAASSIRPTTSATPTRPATPPCSTPWPRTLPSTASTASTCCGRS